MKCLGALNVSSILKLLPFNKTYNRKGNYYRRSSIFFLREIGFLPIWNKGLSQDHLKISGHTRIELRLVLINCVKLEMHFGRLLKYRNHVDDMIMKCVCTYFVFAEKKEISMSNSNSFILHARRYLISGVNLKDQNIYGIEISFWWSSRKKFKNDLPCPNIISIGRYLVLSK